MEELRRLLAFSRWQLSGATSSSGKLPKTSAMLQFLVRQERSIKQEQLMGYFD
jgi:hypothetical protein